MLASVITGRSGDWPDWLGGIALVAPLVVGVALAASTSDHSVAGRVGAAGILVSTLLVEALVAPLVGYRRRNVLWSLLPFWGWIIAWRIGTRLTRLTHPTAQARFGR